MTASPPAYSLEQSAQAQLYLQQCSEADLERYHQLTQASTSSELSVRWLEIWHTLPIGVRLLPWLIITALALGGFTMAALLSYSGQAPINIFWLLLLFVGLPLVLAMFTLLMLFIKRPGAATHSLWQRWLPAWLKACYVTEGFRYYLLWLNQWFGLAYCAGGLLIFLLMATAQDLAFGWATTLDLSIETSTAIIQAIAAPWQSWFSAAVPSAELVEASRFFRWQHSTTTTADPVTLGRWWPFIMMTLACYGLLPRLGLLLISQQLLKRALNKGWGQSPLLIYSQAQPLMATPENGHIEPRAIPEAQLQQGLQLGWRTGSEQIPSIQATVGIGRWQDDKTRIEALANTPHRQVTLWAQRAESPQAELMDLLVLLCQQHKPEQLVIALLPLRNVNTDNTDERQQAQEWSWQQFAQESTLDIIVANPIKVAV